MSSSFYALSGLTSTNTTLIEQLLDSISAYDVWLDLGNTGTKADFIAFIKGVQGDKGDQGVQGVQGVQGLKGDSGERGIQGIQGVQGIQGIQGLPGDMDRTVYDTNGNGIVDAAASAPWSGLTGIPATLAYLTGGTFTGKVITAASATANAGLNLPHGTAPTTPVNGDLWTATTGVFARLNGVTQTLATRGSNTFTAKQTLPATTTTEASLTLPHGTAPTTPVNGDLWTTTAGVYARLNGTTALMSVSGHTHAIADVTNLQTTLDGKALASHTHTIANVTSLQTTLDGKAALAHTHTIADVTSLQTTLDGKAASTHTHSEYTTLAEAAAAAPVQSVNGATGNVVLTLPRAKLAAPVVTNPTTTAETVVARWAVPANFILTDDSFRCMVGLQSAGTGTVIWRLRIGAAGTTADTLLATLTTSAAQVANGQGSSNFVVDFLSTTTARGVGYAVMSAALLGTTTLASVVATIVPTAVVYISVTATVSIAAANVITASWGAIGG